MKIFFAIVLLLINMVFMCYVFLKTLPETWQYVKKLEDEDLRNRGKFMLVLDVFVPIAAFSMELLLLTEGNWRGFFIFAPASLAACSSATALPKIIKENIK